jgi:chitinase
VRCHSDILLRYLLDPWADTDIHFSLDTRDKSSTNLYDCLKQLYLLKKQNRYLKVLLSIGRWFYSLNFATLASTALGRSAFASSAVLLVKSLGLDSIDID